MVWTKPRIFNDTNSITPVILNKYLSDNMSYLYERPRNIITQRDIGDYLTSSTTPVVISDSELTLRLTTYQQSDLWLWFSAKNKATSDTAARELYVDVLMDDDIWLSSMTSTQTDYLYVRRTISANSHMMMNIRMLLPDIAAGVHTFVPYWWVSAAIQFEMNTNPMLQFGVMEL